MADVESPRPARTALTHGSLGVTLHPLDGGLPRQEEWRRLARREALPTAHPAWTASCLTGFGTGGASYAVTVEREGELVAATTLTSLAGDDRVLVQPGVEEAYEPTDVLAADDEARAALVAAVVGLRRPVRFGRLPAGSPTVAALRDGYHRRGRVEVRDAPGSPRIVLSEAWEDPVTQLSSRRRSDARRARRRAEAEGVVVFETSTPTVDQLPPLLDLAQRIEAAGWKGRAGSALRTDPAQRTAISEFARALATELRLRLSFLRIGGVPAAMQLSVEHAGAAWVFKVGYDEAFARCSPGVLLTIETVADAARRGLRSFEFLGCPEPWTQAFTDNERPMVGVRCYPAAPSGISRWAHDSSRRVLTHVRSVHAGRGT